MKSKPLIIDDGLIDIEQQAEMLIGAIRCQVNAIERRAREYRKTHGGRMATARNIARKELGL